MTARDTLHTYAGTPCVLPDDMLDAALDAYRSEVLVEAASELDRIADAIEAGTGPGAQILRDAAGNVRYLARQDTSGAPGGESTQPAPDPMPVIRAVLADFNFDAYEAFTEYDRLGIRSDPDAEWVGDLASAIAGAIGGETEDAAPDFFQPGRTYSDGNGYQAPELITLFRVEHVTRHPDRGHLRAIGWMKSGTPGAPWHGHFQDEGEFEGWIEAGESRG